MAKFKGLPVAVHCSAGIGRTGTLIAIDHCRDELKTVGETDPLVIIDAIRHDRCALVQHPQQFEFVHEACVKYAELHKTPFVVEGNGKPAILPNNPPSSTSSTLVLP
jgi:protein tyrosine phosphatase